LVEEIQNDVAVNVLDVVSMAAFVVYEKLRRHVVLSARNKEWTQ
jgi:hypothetical protein